MLYWRLHLPNLMRIHRPYLVLKSKSPTYAVAGLIPETAALYKPVLREPPDGTFPEGTLYDNKSVLEPATCTVSEHGQIVIEPSKSAGRIYSQSMEPFGPQVTRRRWHIVLPS